MFFFFFFTESDHTRLCQFHDEEDDCRYFFTYEYVENNKVHVEVQQTKGNQKFVNVNTVEYSPFAFKVTGYTSVFMPLLLEMPGANSVSLNSCIHVYAITYYVHTSVHMFIHLNGSHNLDPRLYNFFHAEQEI